MLIATPFRVIDPVAPAQTEGLVEDRVVITGAGLMMMVVDELDGGQPGTVAVTE